jgi:NitT/TauT family transport system substrate-binding protein
MPLARRSQFLAALGTSALATAPARAQNAPVRVVTAVTLGARAALWAQQSGIFRKNGLEVEIIPTASGSAGLSAVLGGSAQIVYLNTITLLEAHERGIALQIVAPGGYYSSAKPYALLFVKKDAPIKTGRDLNGRVLGAGALKDINAITAVAWIDLNGGDSKTVRTVEVPNASLLPAIDEGRIDVATILPPFQTQALDSGKYRTIGKPYDAIAPRFEIAAWVATVDWTAKNPDAAARFAAGMRESSTYCNANPDRTADVVAAFTKIDAKVVARSPSSLDPPYLEPADLQPVIEAAVKYGLIAKSFDAAVLLNPAVRRPAR